MSATTSSKRDAAAAAVPPSIPGVKLEKHSLPSSSSVPFRLLTINACVFPSGFRNKHCVEQLQLGLVFGIAVLVLFFNFVSSSPSTPSQPAISFFPLRLPMCLKVIFSPFLLYISINLGVQLHAGLMNVLTGGEWHDHKKERLALLLSYLKEEEFDCCCFQELFCGWFDNRHQSFLLDGLRKLGYHYAHTSPFSPILPALSFNPGLLIVSRHPIVEKNTHVFEAKALFERLAVTRAALHARIAVPIPASSSAQLVDVFTVHLAPPLREVVLRFSLLRYIACAQLPQILELVSFMSACTRTSSSSSHKPVVFVAGDFNVDGGSEEYRRLQRDVKKQVGVDMVDYFNASQEKVVNVYEGNESGGRFIPAGKLADSSAASVAPASPLSPPAFSWRWACTFGRVSPDGDHEETFLTHHTTLGSGTTFDHVFGSVRKEAVAKVAVERFIVRKGDEGKHPFQQVSDHCGLKLQIDIPVVEVRQ